MHARTCITFEEIHMSGSAHYSEDHHEKKIIQQQCHGFNTVLDIIRIYQRHRIWIACELSFSWENSERKKTLLYTFDFEFNMNILFSIWRGLTVCCYRVNINATKIILIGIQQFIKSIKKTLQKLEKGNLKHFFSAQQHQHMNISKMLEFYSKLSADWLKIFLSNYQRDV